MSVCVRTFAGVKGDQERVSDPLELDLDGSLGAWYGYGNRTWVLCKHC